MKVKKGVVLCITLAIAIVFVSTQAVAEDKIKWKAQAFWSPSELTYKTFVQFCENVKTLTGGRLEITPYSGGAIVPNGDALDAVKNNIIQAMHMAPAYFSGKELAFAPITDLPYAWKHPWELDAFFYFRGGVDLLNELYKPFGVHCVGVVTWGPESFPSKFPVKKPEDFKGHKLRIPPSITGDIMTKLGASPVNLPGSEVFSALDKGMVDGADWSTPSGNQQMGLDKVTKYFIYPEYRSLAIGDFTVNEGQWNRLPDDIKQILKVAVRAWFWDMADQMALADLKAVKEMKANGLTQIAWSDEDNERMLKLAQEVWEEWAKKGPKIKRVIDAEKAFLKELGRIQ